MTNQSRECAKEGSKKAKVGYTYQEVPDDEETPGTTKKELGAQWGIEEAKSGRREWMLRQDTCPRSIPSGLDPTQDEQGGNQFSLDQPEKSGGDRRDLDQVASANNDRSEREGLDQPMASEEAVSDDGQLFYTTDEGGQEDLDRTVTAKGTWKKVKWKGGRIASPSKMSIVECTQS